MAWVVQDLFNNSHPLTGMDGTPTTGKCIMTFLAVPGYLAYKTLVL